MTVDAWLTVIILLATIGLLSFSRVPPLVIYLGALTVILTLRIAPESAVLAGFSNTGVLTVGALFMVAAGMYATGAVTMIANKLIGRPKTITRAQLKILTPAVVGSGFLNNTPIVAMLIPVIDDLEQSAGLAGAQLYLPLSFAAILGGAATVIGTSSNLILAGLVTTQIAQQTAQSPPMHAIGIFEPALVGIPAAIVGILFIILVSKRLLPSREQRTSAGGEQRIFRAEFLIEVGSPLAGMSLGAAGLADSASYRLDALTREDGLPSEVTSAVAIQAGDQLSFTTDVDNLPRLWASIGLVPANGPLVEQADRYDQRLVEVVPAPESWMIGRRYGNLPRADGWGDVQVVAVSRQGRPLDTPIPETRVAVGDNIVLAVTPSFFEPGHNVAPEKSDGRADSRDGNHERGRMEFLLTRRFHGYRIPRTNRALVAIAITVAMVVVASLGWMSMLNAALIASGAMLLTGCMTVRTAARSVDFKTLIILAASLSLEAAVTASGLSTQIAQLLQRIGGGNAHIALAVIFFGCIILTNIVSNAAAAAIIFPIALSMAGQLQVDFTPFVIAMMLGTSYAFINPIGYQTNLMVMEPGGYRFGDFVRIGVPLTMILAIVVIVLTPLIFPFS